MAQEKLNPWGLVYDGALTENVVGEVQLHPVSYEVGGLRVHLWDHLRIGGEGHIFIPFLGTSDKY